MATYTTNFPSPSENPIVELVGGVASWRNGAAQGTVWTNCRKTVGMCFGTMTGNEGGNAQFADSTAVLTGTWGPDQTAQATVRVLTRPTQQEEVEIRLRTTINANVITGYEINLSVSSLSQYLQIVRWNGGLGSFFIIDSRGATLPTTGMILKAFVTGGLGTSATITAQLLDVGGVTILNQFTVVDSNATNGGLGNAFTNGSPGVGFYQHNESGVNANFGFSDFTATDGLASSQSVSLTAISSANLFGVTGVSQVSASSTWDRGAYEL